MAPGESDIVASRPHSYPAERVPEPPHLSVLTANALKPINALFDRLYHSEYNPFYRSGTLAIGLLFVLLASGFYLLFFYSVSAPYESTAALQDQVILGRWVRALHRYATDATLIAVIFHVLQLLAQGKTWGPRTLAWISGIVLFAALIVSTVTGYVMVWDSHAQLLALSGLKLLSALPFVGDEMALAFSGRSPLPSSFFFMNLFLHVAIPLGIVFGMWIHTARLARTVWFPIKPVFYVSLLGLIVLSIVIPAPLPEKADLLKAVGPTPVDLWYGFWIPLLDIFQPALVFSAIAFLFVLGCSIPFWWRPAARLRPPISQVDEDTCTGCTQCARDCPYEAISMVPHKSGKRLLAQVSALHCVSCGVCAASCNVMAVGPAGRVGADQVQSITNLLRGFEVIADKASIALIACRHNGAAPAQIRSLCEQHSNLFYFDLNCCATLHSDTVELLLSKLDGVFISGCAARNCTNRDGLNLLKERLFGKRVPFVSQDIDKKRIFVAPHSEFEHTELAGQVLRFQRSLTENHTVPAQRGLYVQIGWWIKRSAATILLLLLVAGFSQFPIGAEPDKAYIRVVGMLPSAHKQTCRALTEEERNRIPQHMQQKEICEQQLIKYRLKVVLNGAAAYSQDYFPRSSRGDKLTVINAMIEVPAGKQSVSIALISSEAGGVDTDQIPPDPAAAQIERKLELTSGQIALVDLNNLESALVRGGALDYARGNR